MQRKEFQCTRRVTLREAIANAPVSPRIRPQSRLPAIFSFQLELNAAEIDLRFGRITKIDLQLELR